MLVGQDVLASGNEAAIARAAAPVGRADVRDWKAFETMLQHCLELMRVEDVEDLPVSCEAARRREGVPRGRRRLFRC